MINDLIAPTADPRLSFGGNRTSGYGRTRGREGLLEMTRLKSTVIRRRGPLFHLREPSSLDSKVLETYVKMRHGEGLLRRVAAVWNAIFAISRERIRARIRSLTGSRESAKP